MHACAYLITTYTLYMYLIGLPLLYHSTKNGEIRYHQFVEIATDLRGIGESVIGHVFMYKSLSIPWNNQK